MIDYPQVQTDREYVSNLLKKHPELDALFRHTLQQWKLIVMGTQKIFAEKIDLPHDVCGVLTRALLSQLFENYCLGLQIWLYFKNYSQVEYEQMVAKLLTLPTSDIDEFLKIAAEDTEKALDFLEITLEAKPRPEENNGFKEN
jgi:hypothetical protein